MKKAIVSILFLAICITVAYAFKTTRKSTADYTIVKKWELPEVLAEVSAIEWIAKDRLAAIQDEDGIIFIFNLETSDIEERIKFAAGGDYEGLRIEGKKAFVLRSDGLVYEIRNFRSKDQQIIEHPTELTKIDNIDMEGLYYDHEARQLLLATKDREKGELFKDIYALNLESDQLSAAEPHFRIDLSDPIFEKAKGKQDEKFTPSEIERNPVSGKLYFLDAKNPKLLITDNNAKPEVLYLLEKKDFPQPEGLSFSPDGKLFISNEAGKDSPATILQVQLKD